MTSLVLAAMMTGAASGLANADTYPSVGAPASFVGRIPGADVAYINVTLTLRAGGSYQQRYVYEGKGRPFVEDGTWRYDAQNGTLALQPAKGRAQYLRFTGRNTLEMLDADGDPIVSKNKYTLRRAPMVIALGAPGSGGSNPPGPPPLEGTRWLLVFLNDHRVITPSVASTPSLELDAKTERASGTGGCNRFTGSYTATASGELTFGLLASTRMACADTMATENEYFKALALVRGYHMVGSFLHLVDAKGENLANFTPAP